MDVARVDTEELAASLTGLADGEYWLRVEAASDEQTTDGGVRLNQLVHCSRLVYRSEVPIMGAMDVWGQDNIHVIAGGFSPDVGVYVVDTTDPTAPWCCRSQRHGHSSVLLSRTVASLSDLLMQSG